MLKFFFVVLIIPMLNAMEKENITQRYLQTPRAETAEELMMDAFTHYNEAEKLYKEALKTTPETFAGSKYETAEQYYFLANNLFTAAANKGYVGAATLARHVIERIHDIERIKFQLNQQYSVSEGFQKSLRRTERTFTQSEADAEVKELISWQQALRETNIQNIKEQLKKKECEATEKALSEASKEKIKEQFKKTKETAETEKKKKKTATEKKPPKKIK